jgi:chromosome segregation ATPase
MSCDALILKLLELQEARIMSVLSDKIAEVNDAIDASNLAADEAIARVKDDVDDLREEVATLTAKVAELQAAVDAGTATPEDLAALDMLKAKQSDLKGKLDALDPTISATLPVA